MNGDGARNRPPQQEWGAMRARLLPVVLGAVVGTAVAASAVIGTEPPADPTGAPYARLAEAAAAGDADSIALKRDLDAYLAQRGLAGKDLTVPQKVVEQLDAGPDRLRTEDQGPWVFEVRRDPDINDAASLKAYRASRHSVLKTLAAKDPGRRIDAFLAPRTKVALSEFAVRNRCDCSLRMVIVDVWGPDGWIMSSGRVFEGKNLTRDADAIEGELREQAGVSLGQYQGLGVRDVVITLRQAEVTLPAALAVDLIAEPDVYAVDTTADLEDAFRGRAAVVEVGTPPDLHSAYRQFVLEDVIEPAYEPTIKESK